MNRFKVRENSYYVDAPFICSKQILSTLDLAGPLFSPWMLIASAHSVLTYLVGDMYSLCFGEVLNIGSEMPNSTLAKICRVFRACLWLVSMLMTGVALP